MNRKTIVGMSLLFMLSMVPIVWILVSMRGVPSEPGGGGGGSAFSIAPASPKACGPICEGILGYLIAKAGDYIVEQAGQPCSSGGGPCGAPGPGGGGGGGAFPSPYDATSDPVITAKTN
jgi:hypothetical protein